MAGLESTEPSTGSSTMNRRMLDLMQSWQLLKAFRSRWQVTSTWMFTEYQLFELHKCFVSRTKDFSGGTWSLEVRYCNEPIDNVRSRKETASKIDLGKGTVRLLFTLLHICSAFHNSNNVVSFGEECVPVRKNTFFFFIETGPVWRDVFGFCRGFA